MSSRIRVGLVGPGVHGIRYARHIANDVPGLQLVGVMQRRETECREAASELGVPAFNDLDTLLAACEAVVVVTPPPSHAEVVVRALKAGARVLVEKPVTSSAEEAAAIVELDRSLGGRVMVAQTLRFDPVIRGVKDRISHVAPVKLMRMAQRLSPAPQSWQRSLAGAGGGSILLTGVHLFDTIRWILDEEITIRHCVAEHVVNPAIEDFFIATGTTPSGIHLSMEVSKYTSHRASFIEVVGENGQILGDYHLHALSIGTGGDRDVVADVSAVPTVRETLNAFERWLRGETKNPIPLEEGVAAVAVADQCYRMCMS